MAELLLRDIPDHVAEEIRRSALKNGVSPEEEAVFVLSVAIVTKVSREREPGDEGYTLLHHLWRLGDIAPDIDFAQERKYDPPRPLDVD